VNCRHCGTLLQLPILDLCSELPSCADLKAEQLLAPKTCFPLWLLVCTECCLVQTEDYVGREMLFTDDYTYFSSFFFSWLSHSKGYVRAMQDRFSLDENSLVV